MNKPRNRSRRSGNNNGDPKDPDRQPANLDHRKGHRSLLRDGLPDLQRGRSAGNRPDRSRSRDH